MMHRSSLCWQLGQGESRLCLLEARGPYCDLADWHNGQVRIGLHRSDDARWQAQAGEEQDCREEEDLARCSIPGG